MTPRPNHKGVIYSHHAVQGSDLSTWGIDLGVRSIHVARIAPGGALSLHSEVVPIHRYPRGTELSHLFHWLSDLVREGEVWIEEPPLAGTRNLRTFLHLAQVSGVVGAAAGPQAHFVPVSSWKKGTVGNGSASKRDVADWLGKEHSAYARSCDRDQNLIDATCIALYGQMDLGRQTT